MFAAAERPLPPRPALTPPAMIRALTAVPTAAAAAPCAARKLSAPDRCGWPITTSLASCGPNQASDNTVSPKSRMLSAPPASSVSSGGRRSTNEIDTDAISASTNRRTALPTTQPSGRSAIQAVPENTPQGNATNAASAPSLNAISAVKTCSAKTKKPSITTIAAISTMLSVTKSVRMFIPSPSAAVRPNSSVPIPATRPGLCRSSSVRLLPPAFRPSIAPEALIAPASAFQLLIRNAKKPVNSTLRKNGASGASWASTHCTPASVTEITISAFST